MNSRPRWNPFTELKRHGVERTDISLLLLSWMDESTNSLNSLFYLCFLNRITNRMSLVNLIIIIISVMIIIMSFPFVFWFYISQGKGVRLGVPVKDSSRDRGSTFVKFVKGEWNITLVRRVTVIDQIRSFCMLKITIVVYLHHNMKQKNKK